MTLIEILVWFWYLVAFKIRIVMLFILFLTSTFRIFSLIFIFVFSRFVYSNTVMTQPGFNDNGINRNWEVQLVKSSEDILPTLALLGMQFTHGVWKFQFDSHYLVNFHAISDRFCANFNRRVAGHWLAYHVYWNSS